MHSRSRCYLVVTLVLSVVPVWMSRAREHAASIWTPRALSSDQYESTPTFTPDGREMYFMRADPAFERYRLLWSRCEAGRWSAAEPVPFGAPAGVQEADPAVTPDGRRLYFISSRHDPANEDFDIWYVERARGGRWGEPQRVPEPVASPASEPAL